MPITFICLNCNKENKIEDLKKIRVNEEDECFYDEYVCECGQNKYTLIEFF